MKQFKNLEEALQFLRGRGKRVVECDTQCEVVCGGYTPDALAYDEFNRLVAVVVDNSKVASYARVKALTEFAELDSRITLIVIAPIRTIGFEDVTPEPSGGVAWEMARMMRMKDHALPEEDDEN